MESIWHHSAPRLGAGPLTGDLETEVCVIGGGMAGILTAWYLQRAGMGTVVVEAQSAGSGQTGNTTAKITAQHGLVYAKLLAQFGGERARQYAAFQARAVTEFRSLIGERKIACDLRDCPAYLYSTSREDALREEAHAARELGLEASFTTETELPFAVKGAVRFEHQATFHPLRFLNALARELTVFEHTPVLSVEGGEVKTERGTVRAERVVFATHFPFPRLPGLYFMRMHQERSYVLVLKGAAKLRGVYLGVDPDGLSFRQAGDYLLLGGGNHRTGENSAGGKYKALRVEAAKLWPDSQVAYHWSAQDCMPMDGVPYIGRFSSSHPEWYVATGFGKWGMTNSMVAALLLTGLITGKEEPEGDVFSPQRFDLAAASKNLLTDGKEAVKGLSRSLFEPGRAELERLPNGHGGIVELRGQKVGAYRNEDGETFLVSPRCPHLGCEVEWNPDERTWDCPCHGSRFDFRGRLLDDPAQKGLKKL